MGLWAGGLGGWSRDMEWGEAALLATGGPGSGCGVGSFREMVSTALRGVGARASGAARDLPRGPGSCDCMGLWIDGLGGWAREMGCGDAALFATGGPGSGCGVGSFREMVSTALRRVGVLASGDRRGLKPITELGWGDGGVVGRWAVIFFSFFSNARRR